MLKSLDQNAFKALIEHVKKPISFLIKFSWKCFVTKTVSLCTSRLVCTFF